LLWIGIVLAITFSPPNSAPIYRLLLPLAGSMAIVVAAASYLFPGLLPPPDRIIYGAGRKQTGRATRVGMKGWAGLWRPFLGMAGSVASVPIFFFILESLLTGHGHPWGNPAAAAMSLAFLGIAPITSFGAPAKTSARALRGIPVSCALLTTIFLTAITSAQLLAFGALYMVCRLTHTPTEQMIAFLPLVVGFTGCGICLMLRGVPFAGLPWVGVIWASLELSLHHIAFAPAFWAAGLVGLLASWLWIYLELSRGRRIYRPASPRVIWRVRFPT
jgi:hypothetical protein